MLEPADTVAMLGPKRLNQATVFNSRRARCFARSTIEAQVEVSRDVFIEFEAVVSNGPHEVNTAPRAVVFVTRFEICRTRSRAQSAVNAVEESIVFYRRLRLLIVIR